MKLSIITINYNNKDGLEGTIESVLPELREDYEYIVIDGGSTDGSVDIIKMKEAHLTAWTSEPDKGIYHAMNKGVMKSRGEWVLFMNSGDLLIPGALEILFSYNIDDYSIVYGQNYSSQNGKVGKLVVKDWDWSLVSFMEGCIPHQSTLSRRELLLKTPFRENYRLASCRIFFIETIVLGNINYKYIPVPVSIYDIDGQSASQKELLLEELDDFVINKFGSKILKDIKLLMRFRSLSDNRALYKLLKHSSGRPRLKRILDFGSSVIIKLIKLKY